MTRTVQRRKKSGPKTPGKKGNQSKGVNSPASVKPAKGKKEDAGPGNSDVPENSNAVKRDTNEAAANGSDSTKKKVAGFIFMCSSQTKPECYRFRVFGLPKGKLELVERIKPGTKLFLYDFDLKLLYGIYQASCKGGANLEAKAFKGKFPAQVKFKIAKDCLPLPESEFRHAIKENYTAKSRFDQELSSSQVRKLLSMFRPIDLKQQASRPQYAERQLSPPIPLRSPDYGPVRRVTHPNHPPLHSEPRYAPAEIYPPGPDRYLPPSRGAYGPSADLYGVATDEPRDPYSHVPPRGAHYQPTGYLQPDPYYQTVPARSYPESSLPERYTAADLGARDYKSVTVQGNELVPGSHMGQAYIPGRVAVQPSGELPHWRRGYEYQSQAYSDIPRSTAAGGRLNLPVSSHYSFAGPSGYN